MLRPYQQQAIKAIREQYAAGVNRQLLVDATGTGKTEIFAHLPEETKDILPGERVTEWASCNNPLSQWGLGKHKVFILEFIVFQPRLCRKIWLTLCRYAVNEDNATYLS